MQPFKIDMDTSNTLRDPTPAETQVPVEVSPLPIGDDRAVGSNPGDSASEQNGVQETSLAILCRVAIDGATGNVVKGDSALSRTLP